MAHLLAAKSLGDIVDEDEWNELIGIPSSTQTITTAAYTILADARVIVLNPDADYTMTSTPTIANGTTTGQLLRIICANAEANTITLQDEGTLGSSNLRLTSPLKTITGKEIIVLMFDGTNWVEQGTKEFDQLLISGASPTLTFKNLTAEDIDGGRESTIAIKGIQSGDEETTLVWIRGSHDGAADDEKGRLEFYTNAGADADTPTLRMTLDSGGDTIFEGPVISKGIPWTTRTSSDDNNWYDVTYGNGLFVAVAITGTGDRVMTSPDGVNWTTRTSSDDNNWISVTYGNGLFVAVAITGTGDRVMTSPDGITWTTRTSSDDNDWRSVTYGNGLFVAVANTGTNTRVMTSPDGITWTTRTSSDDNNWYGVTYGNGLFVAVAITGTGDRVMTSSKAESNIVPTKNIYQGGMTVYGSFDILSGVLGLTETTTPGAVAGRGKIYTKADNLFYAQTGDGVEHAVSFDTADYAGIWVNDNAVATTILLVDAYEPITVFDTDMPEKISSGDNANYNITIGGSGDYFVSFVTDITSAGNTKTYEIDVFQIAVATQAITGATQANPCVVTATGHSFSNGNMVKFAGIGGMTELNGQIYTVANAGANDFELNDDNAANINSGAYGAYATPGTAQLATGIGVAHSHHTFGVGVDFGTMGGDGIATLVSGDTLELHVKGITDATNLTFDYVSFHIKRLS